MSTNFYIAWCPFCNQGWIEIVKDPGNGKLLLLCTECDTTWDKPGDIESDNPMDYGFIGTSEIPSINEVQEMDWYKLLIS